MVLKSFSKFIRLAVFILMGIFIVGCAQIPVQEMSDARQTLRSAYEEGAEIYASEALSEAEILLKKASVEIDEGEYELAREHAFNARDRAVAARDISIYKKKMEKNN